MVWKVSKRGEFLMKSVHSALEEEGEVSFPPKIVWDSWVL